MGGQTETGRKFSVGVVTSTMIHRATRTITHTHTRTEGEEEEEKKERTELI